MKRHDAGRDEDFAPVEDMLRFKRSAPAAVAGQLLTREDEGLKGSLEPPFGETEKEESTHGLWIC